MPDDPAPKPIPPIGDHRQAEKYIDSLIRSLRQDAFTLTHSDLSKYDPCSIQDHYRVDLGTYHAEISHSIHPETKQSLYSLIFTSIAKLQTGTSDQAILSYIPLTADMFAKFKKRRRKLF